MKLTKQRQSAALKVHDLYFESYIKGDIDRLSALLVENYSQIGSVEEEVFFTKKDALKFVFDTIDQVAGKLEMRNRTTTHELFDDFILIFELCDLYVLIENEWTFYSRFRATSILQEKPEGWKIVHQHSSLPDSKAQEGENIAIEKISEENLQLRDAIKRRTIELENKNRELEIEAALERVRATAMSMQKSGDLKTVVGVLYDQLRNLGFQFGIASIIIMDQDTGDMDCWNEGFDDGYVLPESYHVSFFEHPAHLQQLEQWKSGIPFAEIEISGQEKKTYDAYYFHHTDFSRAPESTKQLMMQAETVRFSMAFMKYGALSWSPSPLSKEQASILERFAKVFEQCYTRFLDLQKAEAQAREAQIEAALEKVRSRSLAMHKSEELKEVVKTVVEKIQDLSIEMNGGISLVTFEAGSHDFQHWLWIPGRLEDTFTAKVVGFDHPILADCREAQDQGLELLSKVYGKKDKQRYFKHIFEKTDFRFGPKETKDWVMQQPFFGFSFAIQKHSGIFLNDYSGKYFSKETNDILVRFSRVFEQAYVRFLDLQKAEAQAREAQIEAALERVRAKAMAMHKSEELRGVIQLVYEQLVQLNIRVHQAGFIMDYKKHDDWYLWMADYIQPIPTLVHFRYFDHPMFDLFKDAKARALDFSTINLTQAEKNKLIAESYKYNPGVPNEIKEVIFSLPGYAMSASYYDNIVLFAANFEGIPLTDQENDVIRKFGKVFEQTYTRFLDLKNAEAQAKEAQIEAGLERVRSAAMAMHQSDDLRFSLKKLFEELDRFQLGMIRCGIAILDPERPRADVWIMAKSGDENAIQLSGDEPLDTNFMLLEAYQAWKEGNDYEYVLEGKKLSEYYHSLDQIKFQSFLTSTFSKKIKKQKQHYFNAAFKHGSLFAFFEDQMPESGRSILKRFSNVLNLAYSRFRDIQSAEAQTREAQIQLALERVRARTMAMQHSSELADAAQVLYQQFGSLNVPTLVCGFIFIQEEKGLQRTWTVLPDGSIKKEFIDFPLTGDRVLDDRFNAWKQKVSLHKDLVAGKENKAHHKFLAAHVPKEIATDIFAHLPDTIHFYSANFNFGYLHILRETPFNSEEETIVIRFAKVFEQTYTRFLDLQKAEAQAREAKIETALEKVRSKSLAMHRSEELQEVVTTVFERLKELDIQTDAINLDVFNENKKDAYLWTAVPGHNYSKAIHIPYTDSAIFKDIYDGMISGKLMLSKVYSREFKDEFFNYLFEHTDFREIPQERKDFLYSTDASTVSVAYAKNTAIIAQRYRNSPFSDDENEILKRFAKVFDQAYTRFLDLQKAEAQAREAQIEASLERVRSRTMAMHSSEDVTSATETMFDELKKLGIQNLRCGIANIHHDRTFDVFGVTNLADGNKMSGFGFFGMDEHPIWQRWFESWKNKEEVFIAYIAGEEKEEYFNNINNHRNYLPQKIADFPDSFFQAYLFEQGSVWAYSLFQHNEQEKEIMKRFATGFSLTFRRYQDLKKAEAQAREALIEAALERVRSQTMAMHKSEDLLKVITVVSDQLQHLNFKFNTVSFAINSQNHGYTFWFAILGDPTPIFIKVPYIESPMFDRMNDVLAQGIDFYADTLTPEENRKWHEHVFDHAVLPSLTEETKAYILRSGYARSIAIKPSIMLIVSNYAGKPYSDSENEIIKRFGTVFEQSYTRFLDLQKAEGQAREAQIEAALERVRARTMAMHNSSELIETAELLFDQLKHLGAESQGVAFAICDKESIMVQKWTSIGVFSVPYTFEEGEKRMYEAWKNQTEIYEEVYEGERLRKYYELFMEIPEFKQGIKKFIDSGNPLPDWQKNHAIPFKYGYLLLITTKPFEETHIFTRFAKVFEQTYTRFLDLQKAEGQAREAQIENALEKVRSRSLAMHKSDELQEVISTVLQRLNELGLAMDSAFVGLPSEDKTGFDIWIASNDYKYSENLRVPFGLNTAIISDMENFFRSENAYFSKQYSKEEKDVHYKSLFELSSFRHISQDRKDFLFSCEQYGISMAQGKFSMIQTISYSGKILNELEAEILKRFSRVFEQAYTRFLDLQKAEVQAREAQIEAALEKVRSRTMAMQHSDELAEAAFVLFQQLQNLGVVHERINIGIVKQESKTIDFWITEQGGNQINTRFTGRIDEPTTLSKMYMGWKKNQKSMVIDMTGEDLANWLKYLKEEIGIPFDPAFSHNRRVQTVGFFSKGMLVVTTPEPLPEENLGLLEKFAGVFDLTYTRFSDLKNAEAQAREAQIEVALERIRARALAMQSSTELSDVANVLREQMGILGQEDLEASVVHLYSAGSPTFDSWYAFRAGDKIIEGQTTFRLENSALAKEFLKLYLDEITEYTIEVKGEKLKEWLAEIKRNAPKIAAYWGDLPPEKQFYHFSDFSGGALLMVSHKNLSEETRMLQKRCAWVFELAYKRFLDLEAKERQDKELREEKQRLEKALSELKATQSQLIQSEKMASLGQLTAGIAHEIKNPLNFVNNFSEVSAELIDEVFGELEKLESSDSKDEIIAILMDVKNNIAKVNEHGKRADGIVKSMLQHSRTSGNKIESSPFNPLVREFTNLAYHGMRAGKSPINVEIDFQLDPEVGEVKMISEDFSRVILNLCNNAFDAMREKLQEVSAGQLNFSPKLTISTRKSSDREIQLTIKDNGKGIPKDIIDKILEPFFTTKKGTEGTGLGLSISYDIIKAHGGKLEVRSKVGIGTEFIIRLPIGN